MKICVMTSSFPALSETFISDHVIGMRKRGHRVDVIAAQDEGTPQQWAELAKSGKGEAIFTGPLPTTKKEKLLAGGAALTSLFRQRGHRALASLDVKSYGRQAASLSIALASRGLSGTRRYDVIHCNFGPVGVNGIALREMGILSGPIITHFHGFDLSSYIKQRLAMRAYGHLFKKGDLFIAISQKMQSQLISLGADPSRIRLVRYSIDTKKLQPKERNPTERVEIVSVARLVEKKGLEYGIRSIAAARNKGVNLRWRIIGGGPLEEELRELIASENATDFIELLGARPNRETIELLSDADMLLAPSVTASNGDQEGAPVAIIEAMGLGLPVIGTFHAGIPEIVQHEKSGLLVQERDVPALTEAICSLSLDVEKRKTMGKEGRRFAETELDREVIYSRLESEYESLMRQNIHTGHAP